MFLRKKENINCHENQHPDPPTPLFPGVSQQDAPYSLAEDILRAALYIPAGFAFGADGKTAVLLVPGTGTYGGEAYEHNFGKLLAASAFGDPLWLNIPGRMCDASPRNAEFVAYAIHYITARSAGPSPASLAVVGWSQGNLAVQWALKYWPSTRARVSNFIALSADFAGTLQAWGLCPVKNTPGTPAVWNQTRNASFIATLRADGGDSAYVPTTSVYSATDEVVQPQSGARASALLRDERNVGVTNCELQVAARLKPAGMVYSHEAVMANPLAWALAEDAIRNGGPGQLDRIQDLSAVCMHTKAAGLNMLDMALTQSLAASALKSILLYLPKRGQEEVLPSYTQLNKELESIHRS
ncbi:hypothetical protein ASPZODRAFT_76823 [Penicilliopsis zonata CBS 506.65]|uniref:AB hydrolase-1 domain-containing protein n=1 Tax=Penicilliopsis zonata CBS 506.65 TaxID=1073090 RepID=A0A1L9S5Q1_9EURO|nr:hypothetical protein ASPZODRAFT_76823 [Penicilliopsis zonata CBS 506.65]OJJ42491.1 hypothetical protein ASPZODRAFT_76823 [Penicilliopsis zonata CBS 506.65]